MYKYNYNKHINVPINLSLSLLVFSYLSDHLESNDFAIRAFFSFIYLSERTLSDVLQDFIFLHFEALLFLYLASYHTLKV